MRNPKRKKKIKHRSKGRYYYSKFIDKHHFLSFPLKLVSTIFKDCEGDLNIIWKVSKTKYSKVN